MGKSKEIAELGDVVTQDGGNMLVGTTGHFNYSGGTTEITVGTDGTGSSAGGAVTFVSNNGATTLGYAGFQESEAQIGTMGSRPLKLTTNNTERMRIDSAGRVTMPYQPAFIVRHNAAETYSANTYIDGPWAANLNRGSHFNTSNGIFTAPIGGLYQLNLVQNNRYPDEDGNFQVHVNNSLYAGLQFDPSGTETYWFTHTLVGTLNLSTNDTVRIYSGSSGAVVDNSSWNHWSMYLIG